MNRKETQGQNDISIIIGNLPKRLQEKIITREGKNSSSNKSGNVYNEDRGQVSDCKGNVKNNSDVKRGDGNGSIAAQAATTTKPNPLSCMPIEYGTTSNDNNVTSIDYFLRLSTKNEIDVRSEQVKPVSVTSGSLTNPTFGEKRNESQTNIPGLIRLNSAGVKKMNEYNGHDLTNGLRNHDKRNRFQTRHEMLSTKCELPMSPVRNVQKINHPSWFETLDDNAKRLPSLFESLQNAMSHNLVIENWSQLYNIRQELEKIFKDLLLNNLTFCCEQKIDSFFWKILFYNMREHLKLQQNSPNAIKYIQEIISDGIEFYKDFYQKFVEKYLVKETPSASHRARHKIDLMAKVTAQKLLIYLGDLWRYKAKDIQGEDYAEAAKYYQQAQALVPSNGVPYNQLAIVAIHNRKKFDAIYYHMRSLMASNAIHSSKESLLILFDEIRRKYEENEVKTSPLHCCNYNISNNQSSKSMRKEVWIYPDGVRRLHRTDLNGNSSYKMTISEEKRFSEMTSEELLRRITSLYLYVIGKLYTGVGMETILESQRKLLLQLSILLQNEPLAITRTRLMKMLALNIFIIEHNLDKETRRYHAFNFCNQIFGLLLRKSHELLNTFDANPEEFEDESFFDLNTALQYIRVYLLWLEHHVNIWVPIKNEDHIFINSWLELEKLFNILQQQKLFAGIQQDAINFEEDIFFRGFTPLVSIIPKTKQDTPSEESLQLKARLKILFDFKVIYCANQKRLDNFASSHFINEVLNSDIKQALDDLQINQLIKTTSGDVENENIEEGNEENYGENIINGDVEYSVKSNSLKSCLNGKAEDRQLSQLSKLRRELEAKTHAKTMYHNKLEEILQFVDTKVYIEVRPKYLFPDTNCFIDCLEDFERIVYEFKLYTLIIPLIVVKELDGLSKGVKIESYKESLQKQRIHHYDDVSTRAKKALDFIKTAKSHVKCATTKGSIINASLFALVEEEHVSNDDKILATAISLSKTMSSETSKDGKCFIQTELVLITTDRNLRVKALSRNLAVSELPEFLQWAKDCN